MRRQYFENPPIFLWGANILRIRLFFEKHKEFVNLLDFVAANICVYFQYSFMHLSMRQYFWRSCFNLRFKIDVVVMIIWSIVIIINFVLTL